MTHLITRFICLAIIMIVLFFTGCGGGGGSTVLPSNPTPLPTGLPTTIPTIIPTAVPTLPPTSISGTIIDMFTNTPQSVCQISINGNQQIADANGNFSIPLSVAQADWFNIIVSSENIFTRNFYTQKTSGLEIKTISNSYNMHMFRAYQWNGMEDCTIYFDPNQFPVKFVVYRQTDEGNLVDDQTWGYINDSVNYYIAHCFPAEVEIYPDRPDSDPRLEITPVSGNSYFGYVMTDNNQPTIAIIVCEKYITLTGYAGGGACRFDEHKKIIAGSVVLAPFSAVRDHYPANSEQTMIKYYQMVIPHETGHACGLHHPYEKMPETDWPTYLESSIMNYPISGKNSDVFTQTDLNTFTILNNRGFGNSTPDTNPQPPVSTSDTGWREIFQH